VRTLISERFVVVQSTDRFRSPTMGVQASRKMSAWHSSHPIICVRAAEGSLGSQFRHRSFSKNRRISHGRNLDARRGGLGSMFILRWLQLVGWRCEAMMAMVPAVGRRAGILVEHCPTPGAQMRLFTLKTADDLADVWNLAPTQFENIAGARHLLLLRAAVLLRSSTRWPGQHDNQDRRPSNAERPRDGRQQSWRCQLSFVPHGSSPVILPVARVVDVNTVFGFAIFVGGWLALFLKNIECSTKKARALRVSAVHNPHHRRDAGVACASEWRPAYGCRRLG
jgi:hypothetical protein